MLCSWYICMALIPAHDGDMNHAWWMHGTGVEPVDNGFIMSFEWFSAMRRHLFIFSIIYDHKTSLPTLAVLHCGGV